MSPHATHDHSLTQPSKYAGGDGANQQLADDGGGGGNGNGAGNQESWVGPETAGAMVWPLREHVDRSRSELAAAQDVI
jgi:hypothetical protein